MATLALTVAGAAVGGALLPAGLTFLGATLSGATIGSQVGALAGSFIDQALFGSSGLPRQVSGPRLSDLKVTASTEGAPIPRLYGRSRVGGQMIWAADIEEEAVTTEASGSGKGAPTAAGVTTTDYRYFASFAVALAEGAITGLGRVWADGAELDLGEHVFRLYKGSETQPADSLIVAHEGADAAPAYRGVAYIVFERMALAAFGNRLPQLSFEIVRSVDPFERQVRGIVMIPGSGEFVYSNEAVTRRTGLASTESENVHTRSGGTDWQVSLDQLDDTLPNARSTSLVVSWFGSDLRANHCLVRPAVDSADKDTAPLSWSVAGLDRASAPLISLQAARPAYGGTPSDQTVVSAIRDLRARGHSVLLMPFVLMDIPEGNSLPDPYTGSNGQPAYPWRGRITVAPAPGHPGSPDKTAAAAGQLAALIGTAQPSHFAIAGDSVVYSGPAEWSLRRMVLHYAHLAVAAGGVDAISLGSELRGLTQIRSSASDYPFVAALAQLAADVRTIVGAQTKITYAADWSEYFGHHPADGSGDVTFHLDPLWSSSAIDAVSIDCYWPLADWRDGDHLDKAAGARSIHDLDYLKSNLLGGEGYDWFYANDADRADQVRTPITDGAGKPWVFRYKDIQCWWENAHHNRPGGIESASPTGWIPRSKPIWLTEIGCPAVDKGANQPNVFVDPKSSESFLPYFSRGTRDDLMQRRYLEAFIEGFDPASPGYVAGANPLSPIYGGRMLDIAHIHVYAWDARPYPAFPGNTRAWGDGANWQLGHWLNGRASGQSVAAVIAALLGDYQFDAFDVSAVDGIVTGLLVDRTLSAREALQPLELAFFLDAVESGGRLVVTKRGMASARASLTPDDLVELRPGADLFRLTRAQETDLPAAARLTFSAVEADYRQGVVQSRRLVGASGRIADAQLALVMEAGEAQRAADTWLFEAWAARERARLTLPPSRLAIEPADVVALQTGGGTRLLRVTEVGESVHREIDALGIDPSIYLASDGAVRPRDDRDDGREPGPVLGVFLDLPLLTGNEAPEAGYVAAARVPWPGPAAFYRSPDTQGFTLATRVTRSATTGLTLDPLAPGPEGRIDRANRFRVRLDAGVLTAAAPLNMLAGANALALEGFDGAWEVLQFETATLVAPQTYELARLLRGQAGTERAMAAVIPPGARVVLLDSALTPLPLTRDDHGLSLNWRYGPASRDLGDASYQAQVHAFEGIGLRPLSPVHIRGRRAGNGDLTVTWFRRTRLGGDTWSGLDVPLGEESERYEFDVVAGSTVVRTLSVIQPSVVYTAAQQTADFGGLAAAVTVRIAQVSGAFGRGSPRAALL